MMDTEPLHLMIKPDAKPVAHHTPVPLPVHWQDAVKARLVDLGVIEPVPVGEPVTWCHRMVICAKKDGSPRRTVDLQALNAHAIRENHLSLGLGSAWSTKFLTPLHHLQFYNPSVTCFSPTHHSYASELDQTFQSSKTHHSRSGAWNKDL